MANTSRSFAPNGSAMAERRQCRKLPDTEQVGCNGVGTRYRAGVMMVTSRAAWMRVRVGN
ncbi:MAG: hypothetical protein IJ374_05595 [Lachnospiraceae bacterium]|nr:hypothetical protein [Lachnospiraceae bacterium]